MVCRHAFGTYTGTQQNDVSGQVQMIEDPAFYEKSVQIADSDIDKDSSMINQSKNFSLSSFKKLKLVYPVGRHIGIRNLGTNQMRFVKLPNDVKHVTSLTFNTQKTLLAVAVRNQDLEGYEQLNCTVYVYSVGAVGSQQSKQSVKGLKGIGGFEVKREKQFTLKATNGVPLSHAKCPPVRKNSNGGTPLNASNNSTTNVYFDRYISEMAFSRDDKNLAVCIRNGENECYV